MTTPAAPSVVRPQTRAVRARARPSVEATEVDAAVGADAEIRSLSERELLERIAQLRVERNATILAHNYQVPAIQDIADAVGDSLELARLAASCDTSSIVLCGVHFMAETVALLCPEKRVLSPEPAASCSLAASITADDVRAWRAEHPDAVVVAYVNTDAAVKAEVDICCTSSNAVAVIDSIPADRTILFLPDLFLGTYLTYVTGRRLELWPGECHVHAAIRGEDVKAAMARHPGAHLLLHPESGCVSQCMRAVAGGWLPRDGTHVLSTGGMVQHGRECDAAVDLVATEIGLLHRLGKDRPDKQYVPVRPDAVCEYMKAITPAKVYRSLRDEVHRVTVPEDIATRAREPIERMLAVC